VPVEPLAMSDEEDRERSSEWGVEEWGWGWRSSAVAMAPKNWVAKELRWEVEGGGYI
jgi:hypothetical protein